MEIRDRGGRTLLARAFARVVLTDGSSYTIAEPGTLAPPGWNVRPDGEVALRWEFDGRWARLEVENRGSVPIAIDRLDPLVAEAPAEAALQCGWQSWSWSTPLVPLEQQRPNGPTIAAPMLPPAEGFRSPWVTVLGAPARPEVLVGFVTALDWLGTLSWADGRLVASNWLEGRVLAPGERVASERLLVLAGPNEAALLDEYAAAAAEAMGAKPPARAPTGWCSWYYYYTEVSEAAMLANLERLRDVEVVQLDDGYQTAIGDWLSLNEKFPSGMRALTDAIHARGFQAGLWLAPWLVGEDSRVARAHPDWLLRDEHGVPVPAIFNWGVRCFALDLTHPGVVTHLRSVLRTIVEDWGFDYLKIDFVYTGALRGVRHEPGVTGVQAYRRGLALVREVAGSRFVLGCGAPFLCSLGLVDGMRVGPDTAPDWGHPDPAGSAPALVNAIRGTLAHGWMHGRWWQNDPDCLIVRRENSRLSEDEVRTWATVVALSGGMVLLSDDMPTLEAERAAIVERALPPLGIAARPLSPARDGLPERLVLATGGRYVTAAFNWADAPAPCTFNPAEWPGCPACPYWLLDLWSGEARGPLQGPVALSPIGAHGVRLLVVAPALDRPHLIGSTLTLTGGALEVAAERWVDGTLQLELRCPGRHRGELVLAVPAGWHHDDARAGVLRLPTALVDEAAISLTFRPI